MIQVVNVKNSDNFVYVGRSAQYGGPSPLGNPYRIGQDGDREAVVNQYREWLWAVIQSKTGPAYKELLRLAAIAKQGDLALGCHCAPKRCHAEIIAASIRWLNS